MVHERSHPLRARCELPFLMTAPLPLRHDTILLHLALYRCRAGEGRSIRSREPVRGRRAGCKGLRRAPRADSRHEALESVCTLRPFSSGAPNEGTTRNRRFAPQSCCTRRVCQATLAEWHRSADPDGDSPLNPSSWSRPSSLPWLTWSRLSSWSATPQPWLRAPARSFGTPILASA